MESIDRGEGVELVRSGDDRDPGVDGATGGASAVTALRALVADWRRYVARVRAEMAAGMRPLDRDGAVVAAVEQCAIELEEVITELSGSDNNAEVGENQ